MDGKTKGQPMKCEECGYGAADELKSCPECVDDADEMAFQVRYAGMFARTTAALVDMFIMFTSIAAVIALVTFGMTFFTNININFETSAESAPLLKSLIFYSPALIISFFCWLYFTLMERSSIQGTVGKLCLGLIVTNKKGERPSLKIVALRCFFKTLIFFGVLTTVYFSRYSDFINSFVRKTAYVSVSLAELSEIVTDSMIDIMFGFSGLLSDINLATGLLIGSFLIAGIMKKKQTFYDILVGSYVLKDPDEE